jgi:hypothetical protein
VAAFAVLVIGGATIMMLRRKAPPPEVPAQTAVTATAAVTAPATGRLAINAFPWANVTSIRNLDSGESVKIDELITPAPVDLAPGTYEVTLANPAFRKPIIKRVDVAAGREELLNVHFTDPALASFPRFDGAAR